MTIQISAKNLAALDKPGFCERCFWIKARLKKLGSDALWQIFPGIFSSIDVYTKNVVHNFFDQGGPPAWLRGGVFEGVRNYVECPHHSKFRVLDEGGQPDLRLTGEADGIFELEDGTYLIADYKTGRYNSGQDALLPVYEAQLNAYAHIAERYFDNFQVSRLALVYMEPPEPKAAVRDDAVNLTGFTMRFRARVIDIELNPDTVPRLMDGVRRLDSLDSVPAAAPGCKDCPRVDHLRSMLEV